MLKSTNDIASDLVGIYCNFSGVLGEMTALEAIRLGHYQDGIFCVIPGRLAYYFFHEYELWHCER